MSLYNTDLNTLKVGDIIVCTAEHNLSSNENPFLAVKIHINEKFIINTIIKRYGIIIVRSLIPKIHINFKNQSVENKIFTGKIQTNSIYSSCYKIHNREKNLKILLDV